VVFAGGAQPGQQDWEFFARMVEQQDWHLELPESSIHQKTLPVSLPAWWQKMFLPGFSISLHFTF